MQYLSASRRRNGTKKGCDGVGDGTPDVTGTRREVIVATGWPSSPSSLESTDFAAELRSGGRRRRVRCGGRTMPLDTGVMPFSLCFTWVRHATSWSKSSRLNAANM